MPSRALVFSYFVTLISLKVFCRVTLVLYFFSIRGTSVYYVDCEGGVLTSVEYKIHTNCHNFVRAKVYEGAVRSVITKYKCLWTPMTPFLIKRFLSNFKGFATNFTKNTACVIHFFHSIVPKFHLETTRKA